jgi:hypothetical protein
VVVCWMLLIWVTACLVAAIIHEILVKEKPDEQIFEGPEGHDNEAPGGTD